MRETLLKRLRSFHLAYLARRMLTALAVSIVLVASAGDGRGGARDEPAIKHYVARSRAACETIDYKCAAGAEAFQDKDGCGCAVRPSGAAGQDGKSEGGR
jgi:hypothetical protein